MPTIELHGLLRLVGPLEDSDATDSASARFREYLRENVERASDLRLYVEAALSGKEPNYHRALQDLINHCGTLLGFEVEFGRYKGVQGKLGFDGFWASPTGKRVVVEIKKTDVYAVRTDTLLGYINGLVSERKIADPNDAIGLYVYGAFDAEATQLENAIRVERRQEQLRVVSADALLGLLELVQEYELDHKAVLQFLLPTPIRVDGLIDPVLEIISQEKKEAVESKPPAPPEIVGKETTQESPSTFYLLPAADSEDGTPVLKNLHRWLDAGLWGLGERTRYRAAFKKGDRLCFYAKGIGVLAEALLDSPSFILSPQENPSKVSVRYGLRLKDVRWFEKRPIQITEQVRSRLSAFKDRDLAKGWAWFVQTTSRLTGEDFDVLTGQG
ncbi:MAG: EVE domain-containing protein [Acidobacteria bacterium]|nr:EVE domain-containing protein [Acidobacteriota bacterium]